MFSRLPSLPEAFVNFWASDSVLKTLVDFWCQDVEVPRGTLQGCLMLQSYQCNSMLHVHSIDGCQRLGSSRSVQ